MERSIGNVRYGTWKIRGVPLTQGGKTQQPKSRNIPAGAWPKKETPLPADVITKEEVDIRGARTSAGEFEEAISLMVM